MEYLLIFIFQTIGILLHVLRTLIQLDDEYPEAGFKQVFRKFISKDWDTLSVSVVLIVLDLTVYFVIDRYASVLTEHEYYELIHFTVSLLVGYFGQKKIYQIFGKAEKFIDQKIDSKLK